MARGWSRLVDMSRSHEDKEEIVGGGPEEIDPVDFVGDYPPGLCLSFDEEVLEKLDLDDEIEVGDTIDLRAFARVTSVNKTADEDSKHCRVELQICNLAVEVEDTEEVPG